MKHGIACRRIREIMRKLGNCYKMSRVAHNARNFFQVGFLWLNLILSPFVIKIKLIAIRVEI